MLRAGRPRPALTPVCLALLALGAAASSRGDARIVWRNPAPEALGERWFHLYLNASQAVPEPELPLA